MSPITDSDTAMGVARTLSGRFNRPRSSDPQEGGALLSRAIARAKQGDPSAFHFLYVRYADDVFGCAQSIVRNRHDAEDITYTVFVKLIALLGKYEEREVSFAAWILQVTRNAALDHVRSRRQTPFEQVRTSDEGHDQTGFERFSTLKAVRAAEPLAGAGGEIQRDSPSR
jgi:DNA-directed RNA polymerase specialized sigma24 family protein